MEVFKLKNVKALVGPDSPFVVTSEVPKPVDITSAVHEISRASARKRKRYNCAYIRAVGVEEENQVGYQDEAGTNDESPEAGNGNCSDLMR